MNLVYVTNARIPTEKAHGLQIMKACESFALRGINIKLVVPSRLKTPAGNPFDYYGINKKFPIKKLFCVDLFWLPILSKRVAFYIQSLTFGFFATLYLLPQKRGGYIFYSRDFVTLFFLCLFGFNPVAEIHDYRSKKPKQIINYILRKSRKIIVNSSGTMELMTGHYPQISKDKFLVIPNGVDLDFFDIKDSKETARDKLGISQNKKIIAYLGSLEVVGTEKGVADLIGAFELLENINKEMELYIIGGPDNLVSKYKKSSNSELVIFTGRVDYKKIPLYLRAVDAVIIPLPEGRHSITTSPIKLFEYMASGKPIIASDLPSLRQYLNDENALFFAVGNQKDMAEKIKTVLNDSDLADKLSKQALDDSGKYSWNNRADKIISTISNIRICYFGDFDPFYSRNRVIIKGLKENKTEVLFCNDHSKGLKKYFKLAKLCHSLNGAYDVVVVGYSDSRWVVPLAVLITSKKVIWDAFYSIYDSWVFDRKLVGANSFTAKYYWFLDWLNCKLADTVLLDTNEHIKYFSKTFNIRQAKFLKVLVGTDDGVFYPREKSENNENLIVHFHGKFIPLQGVEYIIRAAHILKNEKITFRIIGTGQEYNKIKNLARELRLSNITWIDKVDYAELAEYIKNADICLGIFGNTPKTQIVIPNKIYEAIAMAKPVITADTLAVRELFTDEKNILLCKVSDPDDLANKILKLRDDESLREKIAKEGYEVFKNNATPSLIVKNFLTKLNLWI